ncbi:MAG: glycosyltransferase 61 family protein [Phenylobacterium sp.]
MSDPPGGTLLYPDGGRPEADLAAWMAARVGGGPRPAWAGAHEGAITVHRVSEAVVWPRHGVVADAGGQVFRSTAGELLASGLTLEGLPIRIAERLGAVAVFMPHGAGFNYGHFLLEALPSLLALEEAGLLAGRTVLAPRLKAWQRDLLALAFPGLRVHETAARKVAVAEAVFADSLDHYLHRPGPIVETLRRRILVRAPAANARGRRLYLSRRGWSMRVLLGEVELERALAARGFQVIHPERLAAADQIRLMCEAEVVVAASGAALANALFAPPEARIVELLPETFAHSWVRDLRLAVGGEWRGWFAPAPAPRAEVPWRHRLRRGFRFAWRLDLAAFLAWLDGDD